VVAGGLLIVVPEPGDERQRELYGVVARAIGPTAERFVSLADRPEAARLYRETAVRSRLCELDIVATDVDALATGS
jgi:hypothetical protein